jgi:hypothetical protein
MTTLRSDVLVIGSSLGGLVAATYLARAGLRTVLIEEDTLAKRPPLLREPFVLSGLEIDGPAHRVFRELALPLIEQRRVLQRSVSLQVLLPRARIDVHAGRRDLARELDAFSVCDPAAAQAFFEAVDARGDELRARLVEGDAGESNAPLVQRLLALGARNGSADTSLGPMPEGLAPFVGALLAALSRLTPESSPGRDAAMLLRGTREGGFFMPDAGTPFLDLFRRRFQTLHGEIRSAGDFALVSERGELGIELPRGRLFARGVVLAAPIELLRRVSTAAGTTPRWLAPRTPPVDIPLRLFRAEKGALPVGLAARAVVAPGAPEALHWLARYPDPVQGGVEWLLVAGPGATALPIEQPLGDLNPFPDEGLVPVDLGPAPRWDRDTADHRFLGARAESALRTKPPVFAVGAELAPGLGFEGELLLARQAALRLADRLGAKRGLP